MDNIKISQKIVEVLTKKNLTISCAESITAGLISSYLTSVAGASQVFKGGISAYQDEIKFQILNVDKKLIETKSSVCEEVAIQMAENIKNLMHTDLGISTTGVAGPESLKIRNDFVGISRAATADAAKFNWVSLTFVIKDSRELQNNSEIVSNWWKRHEATTDLPLHVAFNLDKGASVLYDVKTGKNGGLTWIQLRPYEDMAKHYSSGWLDGQRYIDTSHAILKEHYADSESVWQHDYV